MKFFAPTANWDMKSESSWWPLLGTQPTSAGVRVSQDTALAYSAVFACTRVISETMASLPLFLLEQIDDRTTRKATGQALYGVLHDMPNREMDISTFLDMQLALQLNWGNAYSEIQRDTSGNIVALWPIHPSRIPLSNIYRNTTNPQFFRQIYAGQPGELVFDVNNDDGTVTPIPASDMFHVPGVLSRNGITGLSIPLTGAESIGIAMATDKHAGAYFRNGAVSNMAIKHPRTIKKETAEYLREQWQTTFGGVQNHYKTLLLEDGMEPVSFSIAPEASQLIESRQLGAREIARLYRVPPHMIADLSRATWANIESEEIAFVSHTMLPWITRWEKAIYRQLLSPAERLKYRAKFNVMGLLRGDSASRSAFYQALFNLGALSPNDVRDFEDMNPIEGGDQYFVPANNLMPLDKMSEMAQAEIDKLKAPPPVPPATSPPAETPPEEDDTLNERIVETLLAQRDQQREFMEKVLLRDEKLAAIEAAIAEFNRLQRENDISRFGKPLEEVRDGFVAMHESIADLAERVSSIPAPVVNVDMAPVVEVLRVDQERRVEELSQHAEQIASKMSELGDKIDGLPAPVVNVDMEPVVESIHADQEQRREEIVQQLAEFGSELKAKADEITESIGKTLTEVIPSEETFTRAAERGVESGQERIIDAIRQSGDDDREARNAAAAEALAVREAQIAERQSEIDAKLSAERAAIWNVIETAIRRELDQLSDWEWKWMQKAIDKPLEWVHARTEYYVRFRKHFEANLGEYSADALDCGIVLDLKWGADRYSGDSIRDLKSLDTAAADNYHDRLKETVNIFRNSQWKDRTATLAKEMVERGVRLFDEQEQTNASDD